MKQAIISIIAVLVFIIISIFVNSYLQNSAHALSTHVKNIQTFAKNDNWVQVNTELSQAQQIWNSKKDSWAMLIDHKEIDYIEQSFAKLTKYIESQNTSDVLAESETLDVLINHIPEIERLEWKNIF